MVATFGPIKNPNGIEHASKTTFAIMNVHENARLVPPRNIGVHHGNPPTLFAATTKSFAFA